MQNMVKSMSTSVYVDGNDIMFLFKDVTEEQKKQLLALANNVCNAGINAFSTLAPKENVPTQVPVVENMQQVAATAEVPEQKETGTKDIYAMSKAEATAYLIKNIDSGVFVGYDNLIRAFFIANGQPKEAAEEALVNCDAKEKFEKNKNNLEAFVEANKPASEFC